MKNEYEVPSKQKVVLDLMASKTDEEIKQLIREYNHLHTVGMMPADSSYYELGVFIAKTFGVDYSIEFTLTFITVEVFNRFLKS